MGVVLIAMLVTVAGCGDSPTAPSNPIPNVAGTYTGPVDASLTDDDPLDSLSVRMTVEQAGSQLTITGSFTVFEEIFDLPVSTGTVNENGVFTSSRVVIAESLDDGDCGSVTNTSSSLTFSGNTARYVENATTESCGTWMASGTLTK